ncbi:MAG: hypothetical protein ACRELX_16345 [Longimicrobiales bacterium]
MRGVESRVRAATLLVAAGLAAASPSCAGLIPGNKVTEFVSPDHDPDRYEVLAVVPMEPGGFDGQIAARARETLRDEGLEVTVPGEATDGESASAVAELCPPGEASAFQGVVFVTWNRMVLRDCESGEIAFSVDAGYAGVDEMARRLVAYVRGDPTTAGRDR